MSEEYVIPEDLKLMPIEMLGKCDKTRSAIIHAAIMLKHRPKFEPRYARIFNVVLADNQETIDFHKEAFDHAGFEPSDNHPLPFPNICVDLDTFAWAITGIWKFGFHEYIFLLTFMSYYLPGIPQARGSFPA